jgi:transcriptional regulator with XRE-family HTH domain
MTQNAGKGHEWSVRIRAAQAAAGITEDQEAARILGVTTAAYSRWVNGHAAPQTEAKAAAYLAKLDTVRRGAHGVVSADRAGGIRYAIDRMEAQLQDLRRELDAMAPAAPTPLAPAPALSPADVVRAHLAGVAASRPAAVKRRR